MSVRHLGVLGVGCACALAMAGDLNPPAGPVAPTMVRLDQIEPRQSINDLPGDPTSVHLITAPGNYVLTADLIVPAGKSGIVVALPQGLDARVSIDPNGFSVIGLPGSGNGLQVNGTPGAGTYKVCYSVNNGSTWTQMGGSGVVVNGGRVVEICGIDIQDCGGDGVRLSNAIEATIDVTVRDCFGNGVSAQNVGTLRVGRRKLIDDRGNAYQMPTRVVATGGYGVVAIDCDDVAVAGLEIGSSGLDGVRAVWTVPGGVDKDIEVSHCTISNALGNGISVIAGPARVRSVHDAILVKDVNADGAYIEDVASLSVRGWTDLGCGGAGLRYHGTTPGHKYIDTLTLRSSNAGGKGVHIEDHPLAESTILLRDIIVDGAAGSGMYVRAPKGRIDAVTNQLNSKIERCAGNGVDIECDSLSLGGFTSSSNGGAGARLVVAGSLDVRGGTLELNGEEGMVAVGGGLSAGKASMSDLSFVRNGFGGAGLPGDGLLISSFSSVRLQEMDNFSNAGSGVRIADMDRDGRLDLVTCSGNGGNGISIEAPSGVGNGRVVASQCVTDNNQGNGIFLEATTGGQVVDCTMSSNGALGLHVIGFGHVVHRNALVGNVGGSMLVPAGNVVGPTVDELTIAGNTNPAANYVH